MLVAPLVLVIGWVIRPVHFKTLHQQAPSQTGLLDRLGRPVGAHLPPQGSWRKDLAPGDVPGVVHDLTLAAEDHRFHRHFGIDPLGLARALWMDLRHLSAVQGGSTLTQQLARVWHPRKRNLFGKAREALDALRLEVWLSKPEILAAYLNLAPWGNRVQGIAMGAQVYFEKDLSLCSKSELAFLLAIPGGPTRYNPWRRPAETRARALRIAGRYRDLYPKAEDVPTADSLAVISTVAESPDWIAPHFKVFLEEKFPGRFEGGAVRTSLDAPLQTACERIAAEQVRRLAHRHLGSAAIVVVENATGHVRAWVGGADFDEARTGQVDMADSPRQPGSSLKPFTYLLALEAGFGAQDALPDVPLSFDSPQGTWFPQNYGRKFYGPVRLREALANSLNLPAVYTLSQLGAPALYGFLTACGVGPLARDPQESGLGLTLGNTEIRLWQMAMLYRTLARGGIASGLRFFEDDPAPRDTRVATPEAVALLTDILADDRARRQGFGMDGPYHPGFPVALKTGTSQSFRDNLVLGYQAGHTVAVWAGNPDRRAMQGVSGVTGAGPIFAAVFQEVQKRWPSPLPAGGERLHTAEICSVSGLAPGKGCPEKMVEKFMPGGSPKGPCTWHGPGGLRIPPAFNPDRPGDSTADHPLLVLTPSPGAEYREDPRLGKRAQALAFRARCRSGSFTWFVDGKAVGAGWDGGTFHHWPGKGDHSVYIQDAHGAKSPVFSFSIE